MRGCQYFTTVPVLDIARPQEDKWQKVPEDQTKHRDGILSRQTKAGLNLGPGDSRH